VSRNAAGFVVFGDRVRQAADGAAHQVALGATDALQELAHQRHLRRLARVRRARQRQVLTTQPERSAAPSSDQRQRLERLGGGAPEGPVLGIAGLSDERPLAIHDGNMDAVAGL